MEAATQAELDRFEALWKRDRDTSEMAARLEVINVRRGATAEAMRTMEKRESKLGPQPPLPCMRWFAQWLSFKSSVPMLLE